jgi:tetratricopeptide (TPR) repeat protein
MLDEFRTRASEIQQLVLADPLRGLEVADDWAATAVGDEAAWARRSRGVALRAGGRQEEAERELRQAADELAEMGLPDEAAQARVALVETLRYLGRLDEASATAEQNVAYLRGRGPERALDVAKACVNLGILHWRRGALPAALATFRESKKIADGLREPEVAATASMNIGVVLADMGRYREALRAGEYALRRYRRLKLPERMANVLMNLGTLRMRRGEYAEALGALLESRELYEGLGLSQRCAEADLDVARTYIQLNMLPEAGDACDRAVAALRGQSLPFELGHALLRSGQIARSLGRNDDAARLLSESVGIFDELGNQIWRELASVMLVQSDADADAHEAAGRFVDSARHLEVLGATDHAVFARLLAAELMLGQGARDEALEIVGVALDAATRLGAVDLQRRCHGLRGVALEQDSPDEALTELTRAIELQEELRGLARADDMKMSVASDRSDLYERSAALRLDRIRPTDDRAAFAWIERGKSRGLLESALSEARDVPDESASERRIRQHVVDLRTRLNEAYERRYKVGSAPVSAAPSADSEMVALERALSEAVRRQQASSRRPSDPRQAASLEEIQRSIEPGTLILAYAFLGQELVCFSIRDDEFRLHRGLGTRHELESAAEWLWFHIRKGGYGAAFLRSMGRTLMVPLDRALRGLAESLVAPMSAEIRRASHLVLVPHGFLHTLPFQSLPFEDGALIDAASISYSPSCSVYAALRARAVHAPTRPLIMAPEVDGLPWVQHESQRVASLFPESRLVTGADATIRTLRELAGRCDAVHLATHGVFRSDNPSFSALQLSDGWLTVGDLAELTRRHALVTLSACHTGMSDVGPGDELIGLTRAVLGAGSASLVASLWAANDETTAQLMTTFYTGLRNGLSRAQSLRLASLRLRESDPHPYFWSPFVLVGAA